MKQFYKKILTYILKVNQKVNVNQRTMSDEICKICIMKEYNTPFE